MSAGTDQVVTVTFDGTNISPDPDTVEMSYGSQDSITWRLRDTSGKSAAFSNVYFTDSPNAWPGDDPAVTDNVASVADNNTTANTIYYGYGINISYQSGGSTSYACLDPSVENEPQQ